MKRSSSHGNEGLPVAQSVWVAEEPDTLHAELLHEGEPTLGGASAPTNKKDEGDGLWSSGGYSLTTGQGNNQSYWGRFDDAQAEILPDSGDGAIPVATARPDDRAIRLAFIRKVYTILSAQLLLTFAMCAMMSLNSTIRTFALGPGIGLYYVNMVLLLVLICALHVYKVRILTCDDMSLTRPLQSTHYDFLVHREPIPIITYCLELSLSVLRTWWALSRLSTRTPD